MIHFNLQDLNNLQAFLNRVSLQGNESLAHAELMIKIGQGIRGLQAEQEQGLVPPPEPPPKNTED